MTRQERLRYWRGIIEQYRDSGLSGAAFSKEHNMNAGRFYHWRRRFSNDHCEEKGGFFELVGWPCSDKTGAIRIQVPNGIAIEVGRGFDPVSPGGVIKAVYRIRPCCQ